MNPLQYAHVECIFTFLSRPTYILEEDIDEDENNGDEDDLDNDGCYFDSEVQFIIIMHVPTLLEPQMKSHFMPRMRIQSPYMGHLQDSDTACESPVECEIILCMNSETPTNFS